MTCLAGLFLLSLSTECAAKQWSLRDCIDYALANNIQLQKAKIKEYSALEDVKQSQTALLPSLNLSTSRFTTTDRTRSRATGRCGTATRTATT